MIVLAISDLHCPYQHKDAFDFLRDLKKKYNPDKIVCLGDEAEFHRLSVHEQEPDMPGAGCEYKALLREMKILYKLFPKVGVCISNHTSRPFRVAKSAGLPRAFIKDYREFLEAPVGWTWQQRIVLGGVVYEHGEGVSGKDGAWKAMMENKASTVIGHIHGFGGVVYSGSPFRQTFAANAGCLVDPNSLAMVYGTKYRNKATLGSVVTIDGVEAIFERLK